MTEPEFTVGTRVARPIFARNSLTDVVGWMKGEVVGIDVIEMRNISKRTWTYTIQWDGGMKQGGYLDRCALLREDSLGSLPAVLPRLSDR